MGRRVKDKDGPLPPSRQEMLDYLFEQDQRGVELPTVGALAVQLGMPLRAVQARVWDLRVRGYLWAARRGAHPLRLTARARCEGERLAALRAQVRAAPDRARAQFAAWLVADGLLDSDVAEDALCRYREDEAAAAALRKEG
jgi:hypothetical protein